jgi:hypothetical protein
MQNDASAGQQLTVHGHAFAFLCPCCTSRVRISRLFQIEPITCLRASQLQAYCYVCYGGLDGSPANYRAYDPQRTGTGQLVPSAFALLEIALACDELEQEPTVARVYRNLWEEGQIWTRASIQAALHMLYPERIAPVFLAPPGQ